MRVRPVAVSPTLSSLAAARAPPACFWVRRCAPLVFSSSKRRKGGLTWPFQLAVVNAGSSPSEVGRLARNVPIRGDPWGRESRKFHSRIPISEMSLAGRASTNAVFGPPRLRGKVGADKFIFHIVFTAAAVFGRGEKEAGRTRPWHRKKRSWLPVLL